MWRKLAPIIVLLLLIAFNIIGLTAQSSPNNYSLHNVSVDEYSLKIIKQLSSVKDRLTGHRGFYNATQFLFNELYRITNGYVILDNYTIAVPIEDDS